jgi:hypothetical protein
VAKREVFMADIPFITVFGGMLAVPCVIAATQGGSKATQGFAAAGALIGTWLALYPHVGFLREITADTLLQVLAIMALVLGVVIAIRLKHAILGTLMITAGVLIAAQTLGIVN